MIVNIIRTVLTIFSKQSKQSDNKDAANKDETIMIKIILMILITGDDANNISIARRTTNFTTHP
jgi:hypothetical protein